MKALLAALLLAAPAAPRAQPPAPSALAPERVPAFEDDLSRGSLEQAARESLAYYEVAGSTRTFPLAGRVLSARELADGVRLLLSLCRSADGAGELARRVRESFDVYQIDGGSKVLFTGYYEPVLQASLSESPSYPYPLYARPADLIEADLADFKPEARGEKLWGRAQDGRLAPYLSRDEIDYGGALKGRGLELAWVRSRWDALNAQIQGSAVLSLPDGSKKKALFDGSNGLPFKSPAKVLVERGILAPQAQSSQAARAWLESHPSQERAVLAEDRRYTFFKLADASGEGPLGTIRRPLTAQRSLAMDARVYPLGAPVYYEVELPGRGRAARFGFIQDTGGAITGPARADLYSGSGDEALAVAGSLKSEGKVYVLLKKN